MRPADKLLAFCVLVLIAALVAGAGNMHFSEEERERIWNTDPESEWGFGENPKDTPDFDCIYRYENGTVELYDNVSKCYELLEAQNET